MKVKKHIHVSLKLDEKIRKRCMDNKVNYSAAIESLIDEKNSSYNIENIIEEIRTKLINIEKNIKYIYDLEKQLYSDLQIENVTDPKTSKSLKKYYEKKRK